MILTYCVISRVDSIVLLEKTKKFPLKIYLASFLNSSDATFPELFHIREYYILGGNFSSRYKGNDSVLGPMGFYNTGPVQPAPDQTIRGGQLFHNELHPR